MVWTLTVLDKDGTTVLFGGSTHNPVELDAVAAEAMRRRPGCRVLIRTPSGKVYDAAETPAP